MNILWQAARVFVRAPAKLNLFFEVLGKRGDGYHEIETLMVPISLYDTLVASDDPSGNVRVDCDWAAPGAGTKNSLGHLPTEQQNLARRAVDLLRSRAGVRSGIKLELHKRIPSAAGLGGGSSDAAAALLAAATVWDLGWSRESLAELGAELGSDVPFFLGRGPAVCSGRGERIEPVSGIGALHFVVVRPPEGLSTAEVYARCEAPARPECMTPLLVALRSGDFRKLGQQMHNRLEKAAETLSPWIGRLEREFARQHVVAARMSGSGTSYFGICRHARHAQRVARRLRARGVGQVYAVRTSN